jgi:DNA-binding transcriptional MocR family regulator
MVTIWEPEISEHSGPRYRAIADAVAEDLANGRLKPGARLPTHRALAERLGVTVGTVSRAYAEAARMGLVTGEIGRGTFVRQPTDRYIPLGGAVAQDAGLVDLSVNHPPIPEKEARRGALQATLTALAARGDLGRLMAYPPDGGNMAHREAGAEWIRRSGLDAQPENVLVCSGSQHAVATVLATILEPGDLVLTEALTYPGMKAVANLLHLRLKGLAMDEQGLLPDAFEAACRTAKPRALYCVPTIQNPTASVMTPERRARIAMIARRHGVAVVEDDIHALLTEDPPPPLSAFAPELSYSITSTSKVLTPGLRIGFLLAPPGMVERLAAGIRAITWAAAPLMAEIASAWIRDGTADLILDDRRREAAARQTLARKVLAGADYCAHPRGYFIWLKLPDPWRSESFTAQLRTRGALVTPAEAFVVGRGTMPHAVRVCLGAVASRATLERALRVVAETLQGHMDTSFPVV